MEHTLSGEQVFFDIYSEAEKRADPAKQNTGLFFFRGKPGAKTAICNAGGGFAAKSEQKIKDWARGNLCFRQEA